MTPHPQSVENAFFCACERYAAWGVDCRAAIERALATPLSVQVWQADDVSGCEGAGDLAGSGLSVTGSAPGKPRSLVELRADLRAAFALMPGQHALNLHAIYGDFQGHTPPRDEVGPEHFASWVDFAREERLGLDFNATCFAHPFAADGLTLSHPDPAVAAFWVRHVAASRRIAAYFAAQLGRPSLHNLWIPDGLKDQTSRRFAIRQRLLESLETIYATPAGPGLTDAVESKLFGIGSEAFVVGSHEFYMGFAQKHQLHLCLDLGHFHPTESVADKISALLLYLPGLLLHLSRGLRWDSDHVLILDEALQNVCDEIIVAQALPRVALALDYFDASINRVGALVSGARAARLALLRALLVPWARIREAEEGGHGWRRLALYEEAKALPYSAVWDYLLLRAGKPGGAELIAAVEHYERGVLAARHRP